MDLESIRKPVAAIEIAQILNIEGMPVEGQEIIRRMAFELMLLRRSTVDKEVNK